MDELNETKSSVVPEELDVVGGETDGERLRPAYTEGDGAMVTIARFEDHTEAEFARGALESAGIGCFLHGENANNLLPAAFGVRLQVSPQDEADARAILAPAGDAAPGEVPAT